MLGSFSGRVFLFGLVVSLVDGLMPRVETLIFGIDGNATIGGKYVLAASFATVILHILSLGKFKRLQWQSLSWFSLFVVLFIGEVIVWEGTSIVQSLRSYYFFLLIFPLCAVFDVSWSQFKNWLYWVSVPLIVLGILQYLLEAPLLDTGNPSDKFNAMSYVFGEKIRAFSLFSSSREYGYFLNIILASLLVMDGENRPSQLKVIVRILFIAIVVVAIYTTLTRTAYLQAALIIAAYILLKFFSSSGALFRVLPWVYAGVAIFIAYISTYGHGQDHLIANATAVEQRLLSTDSMQERVYYWSSHVKWAIDQDLSKIVFGSGIVQSNAEIYSESLIIDNTYIALLLNSGLIGLSCWIIFMNSLWRQLCKECKYDRGLHGALLFLSTWSAMSVFSSYFSVPLIIAALALHKTYANKGGLGLRNRNSINSISAS